MKKGSGINWLGYGGWPWDWGTNEDQRNEDPSSTLVEYIKIW